MSAKSLNYLLQLKTAKKICWNSLTWNTKVYSNGFFCAVETPKLKKIKYEKPEHFGNQDRILENHLFKHYVPAHRKKYNSSKTKIFHNENYELVDNRFHRAIMAHYRPYGEPEIFMDQSIHGRPILYKLKDKPVALLMPIHIWR